MTYIKNAVAELLVDNSPAELAKGLGVSTAMISIWKNKENDFCPRLPIASKLYKDYGIIVYPYDVEALKNYDT